MLFSVVVMESLARVRLKFVIMVIYLLLIKIKIDPSYCALKAVEPIVAWGPLRGIDSWQK